MPSPSPIEAAAYPEAVEKHYGAQLVKTYGRWYVNEEERR